MIINFDVIHYIVDSILGIGAFIGAIPYFKGQYKKGKDKAQEASNKILRDLVDDQKKAIENLEMWRKEAELKMSYLEGRVEELTKKKGDLESIIVQSLNSYFEAHPEMAVDIHTKLKS